MKQLIGPLFFLALWIPSAQAEEKILRVGLLAELSGQFASNGQDCRDGFEAARKYYATDEGLGRYKLSFTYGDSQRDPKVGVSEYRKMLASDHVDVIVANGTPVTMALKPLSENDQIALIGVTGHSKFLENSDTTFRFWPTAAKEAPLLASTVWGQAVRSLAIVTTEDEWNMDFRENFNREFIKLGGEIKEDDSVPKSEGDFAALVLKIRTARPDAVIVNLGIGQAGRFIRKLRENGVTTPLFATYFTRKQSEIDTAGIENIEGTTLVELAYEQQFFLNQLSVMKRKEPANAVVFACFSALSFLFDTLKDNQAIGSRKDLLQALSQTPEVKLPGMALSVVHREVTYPLMVKQIRNGTVSPSPAGRIYQN